MVDFARIKELRDEIGEEDMRAVLDIFRSEASEVIASIEGARDDATYQKAIHFLRSGALNLGLRSFSEHAESLRYTPLVHRAAAARDLDRSLHRAFALIEQMQAAA